MELEPQPEPEPELQKEELPKRKRKVGPGKWDRKAHKERKEREQLRQEWIKKQEEMKNEEIEITYSYWDGSGHRKSVTVSFVRFNLIT